MEPLQPSALQQDRLSTILGMQFPGLDTASVLDGIAIRVSRKTGRIRSVHDATDRVLFSLRTSDGRYLPTFAGAQRMHDSGYTGNRIVMSEDAVPFIAAGKSAFCKHVVSAGPNIAPQSEVLLYSPGGELLAVGTAQQPAYAMLELDSGMAARVKHCRDKQ